MLNRTFLQRQIQFTRNMHILVYGGAGQLGNATIHGLKPHEITSIDGLHNMNANTNIIVDFQDSELRQLATCQEGLEHVPEGSIAAIIVAAGGWTDGNATKGNMLFHANNNKV
jgi:hypothetical protein